jgi:hypothetical protein
VSPNEMESQSSDRSPEAAPADPGSGTRSSIRRTLGSLSRHRRLTGVVALAAVAALVGGAYMIGGPQATSGAYGLTSLNGVAVDAQTKAMPPIAAGTAGPAVPAPAGGAVDQSGTGGGTGSSSGTGSSFVDAINTTLIVKTGQLSLEVGDVDKAVAQAQATITGMGGYVAGSNRSGTDADLVESVTYRLPAARWDDALGSLRKLGSRTLSEQTDSTDVTAQAIDLQARIDNLKKTEAALQAIMARATVIADVIAVETQLSDVQGQIEELTAQANHLTDQASMSTLTVTFQLPDKTVTSQAAGDWTLGSQVDQAVAALVRIGQGLATIGVWALIVFLPMLIGLLVILGVVALLRRVTRRGRSSTGTVAGA